MRLFEESLYDSWSTNLAALATNTKRIFADFTVADDRPFPPAKAAGLNFRAQTACRFRRLSW
jgi:hypothetical protein